MDFTFKLPEAIDDEEQLEYQLDRLKSWAYGCYPVNIMHTLKKIGYYVDDYQRNDFKGRYKTNVTIFHERAKVILTKTLYDKSKGQR